MLDTPSSMSDCSDLFGWCRGTTCSRATEKQKICWGEDIVCYTTSVKSRYSQGADRAHRSHSMKYKAHTLIASILLYPAVVAVADEDTAMLRRVADSVLKQTARRLVDRSTGETITE